MVCSTGLCVRERDTDLSLIFLRTNSTKKTIYLTYPKDILRVHNKYKLTTASLISFPQFTVTEVHFYFNADNLRLFVLKLSQILL